MQREEARLILQLKIYVLWKFFLLRFVTLVQSSKAESRMQKDHFRMTCIVA